MSSRRWPWRDHPVAGILLLVGVAMLAIAVIYYQRAHWSGQPSQPVGGISSALGLVGSILLIGSLWRPWLRQEHPVMFFVAFPLVAIIVTVVGILWYRNEGIRSSDWAGGWTLAGGIIFLLVILLPGVLDFYRSRLGDNAEAGSRASTANVNMKAATGAARQGSVTSSAGPRDQSTGGGPASAHSTEGPWTRAGVMIAAVGIAVEVFFEYFHPH